MNWKLVICSIKDGSLITQQPPYIPGVKWLEVPGTRVEAGSYFQCLNAARVCETDCHALPDHCFIEGYPHVTKLNLVGAGLEVCWQQAEGHKISASIY